MSATLSREGSAALSAYAMAQKFGRLVRQARRAGVAVVADAGSCGVRFMTVAESRADDIRDAGVFIAVDSGCGGPSPGRGDTNGNS